MHWFQESGLNKLIPELLETRVYAGISAGSCITGRTIYNSVQNLFGEKYNLQIKKGLGLVNFQFIPHLNSPYFDKIREEYLSKAANDLKEPVYAADDNTAVKVVDDQISVVSEGKYVIYNH
jgi:dipeptidase E